MADEGSQLLVRMPEQMHEDIRVLAAATDRSMAQVIRAAVRAYLEKSDG